MFSISLDEMEPSSETYQGTSYSTPQSQKNRKMSSLRDYFRETVYLNGVAHKCYVCDRIYSSISGISRYSKLAMHGTQAYHA